MIRHRPYRMGRNHPRGCLLSQYCTREAANKIRLCASRLILPKKHPADHRPGAIRPNYEISLRLRPVRESHSHRAAVFHRKLLQGGVPADVHAFARQTAKFLPGHPSHHGGGGLEEKISRVAVEEGDAGGLMVVGDARVAVGGRDAGPEVRGEQAFKHLETPVDQEADGTIL
jgi:hypothetical protein